jgi:hypothetical protein
VKAVPVVYVSCGQYKLYNRQVPLLKMLSLKQYLVNNATAVVEGDGGKVKAFAVDVVGNVVG